MQDNIPQENNSQESGSTVVNTASSNGNTDNNDSGESRYKDGDSLTFVRVRFPGNSKSFPFVIGKRKFAYGQKVLAMSDRGMTVGYINSFPYDVNFNKSMLPVKSISKVATENDLLEQKENISKEKDAENVCKKLIEKYKLDMVITHVEIIQFGKKAVFYFNAPARVDFRDLVKEMVSSLKMRIELRQISVRDRAAALGAIGACGLQTCCSSFLKNYGNVSIKMAKNQNLALIPSKLNGSCGQIKCCIKYEDDVYSDKRKMLPRETEYIKVENGDIGKVLQLHLIVEEFVMLTDKGARRRYAINQYDKAKSRPSKDWKFPDRFNHIVNETSIVIGQAEALEERSLRFKNQFDNIILPGQEATEEGDEVAEEILDGEEVSSDINEIDQIENDIESHSTKLEVKEDNNAASEKKHHNNNRNRNRNRNRNKNTNTTTKSETDTSEKNASSNNNAPKKKYNKPYKNNQQHPSSEPKGDSSSEQKVVATSESKRPNKSYKKGPKNQPSNGPQKTTQASGNKPQYQKKPKDTKSDS